MKKDWMRTICLILCLALCLGSTAMASAAQVAMGRYVEVPLEIGEGWGAFDEANGTIYGISSSGNRLLKSLSLSKNNWDEIKSGHDEQTSPTREGVNWLAVGKNDTLYLSSGWSMKNEEGHTYIERIKKGKPERVQLDQDVSLDTTQLALCVLPSGELLGLGWAEAYRFSTDGKTKQKYPVPSGESLAVYKSEMAVCSSRTGAITVLDIESGHVIRTLPLPTEVSIGQCQIGYDGKGALYYVCPDGLYRVNAGGTLFEQIADGRLMMAGKPYMEPRALLLGKDNTPIIAYSDGSLIAYRYDENVATEPGTILSVFTLYERLTLRECANQFQKKYPDVMVDLIVALPQATAIVTDDAIRTLNTQVLAGKGPDVIVLDGLPAQSYIDKGVLMDLSPVVKPLIDSGELLPNIAGAFAKDGAIPAVPTRFMMPSIWGEVEGMNTIEDMAAWALANPDSLAYYAIEVEPLIGTFYYSCAPAWFTENGRLDEAKIEAFLTACKAIRGYWTYEAYAEEIIGWDAREGMALVWDWNPYQPRYRLSRDMGERLGCNALSEGFQRQLPYLLRDLVDTATPNGAMASTKKGSFAPLPGQAEGSFVPSLMMGASRGTAHSEVALRFIEFALGEECQKADLEEGFQVNVEVLDRKLTRGKVTSFAGGDNWEETWLKPSQQKPFRGMIDALTTPVIPDFTLYRMIVTESTPFFEDKIDAKQAAANVCAKANAYLSE